MPKGVLASHTYFLGFALRYQEIAEATPDDIHYTGALQLYHVGGQQFAIVGPMLCGMSAHLSRWFSASKYWARARACNATIIDPNGVIMAMIMRQPPSELDTQHSVRIGVGVGTGQVSADVRDGFAERFNVPLMSVYGQTEVGGALFCSERMHERRLGSSGKPGQWGEMAVVDERDRPVPPGTVGELVARPAYPNTFMIGFLNKPDQAMRAWRNLWHHTGDLARRDADGSLRFVDRKKDAVRRRGENVSSLELEAAIRRHPAIKDVAVCAARASLGEDDIRATVVAEPGAVLEPDELFAFFTSTLPYFAIPRYVEVVQALPVNALGRVMKHAIRDRELSVDGWDFESLGFAVSHAERRG
jgi:crotonobetaine/carnitine-CoA ligase